MSDIKEVQSSLIELHKKAQVIMQTYGYPHPDYLELIQQIKQKQLNS